MQIGSQPELHDVDVELFARWEVAQFGACFEEEGEGVFTGENSVAAHGEVERERVERIGLGADEGVPHKGVGVGCGMEDSGSVGEVGEGGEGAGGEQAADGEGIGSDDGGNDHLGVKLLELVQGGAVVGEECQSGEASKQ